VPVILVDANIEGQGTRIWMRMQAPAWRDLATDLDVTFRVLSDVGLDPATRDDALWRFCQAHHYYLLTSNRNQESEDSLEATLRREGTPTTVPVFTLPLPDRVYSDPVFLDRVVEKVLEYVMDAHNLRGTGRLYLP
jgi:hypothetical protein